MDGQQQPPAGWRFSEDGTPTMPSAGDGVEIQSTSSIKDTNTSPDSSDQPGSQGSQTAISWTASEFINHHKSPLWYIAVVAVGLVLAAAVWLLKHDWVAAGAIVVCALALAGYGARRPRQLNYSLDASGLTIGQRHFSFEQFRSFAVISEGAFSSINFLPLRRFSPLTAVYYDPKDEDKILSILTARLPLEERQHDPIDRLMRRIGF